MQIISSFKHLLSYKHMKDGIKKVSELLILILLLCPIIKISYTDIEESISVFKYTFLANLESLIENYSLFLYSFKDFLLKNLALHTGSNMCGWNTVYYLFPLFTFQKLAGGLSLKNLYLFSITTSIISLFLYYYWIRRYWNRQIAFFAALFLGYSAVFQEFARSGNFYSFSIIIALLWIIYMYRCLETKKALPYLFLGLLTGLAMYGYGLLRGLLFVPLYILFSKKYLWNKRCLLFFIGSISFILPGIILRINQDFYQYKGDFLWLKLFFDPDCLIWLFFKPHPHLDIANIGLFSLFLKELMTNIGIFINRIFGGKQTVANLLLLTTNHHAHFLNRVLVIPFFIGIIGCLKRKKEQRYRLLIISSFLIYSIPLLTTSTGYSFARRSVFYIIPIYFFIGLGMHMIFTYLKTVPNKAWVQILSGAIICMIIFTIVSEIFYIKTYILKDSRDVGILRFAKDIKENSIKENIYYLGPICSPKDMKKLKLKRCSLYSVTREGIVLKLALMDNKKSYPQLIEIGSFDEIDNSFKSFYLAKSPLNSEKEFRILCKEYDLDSKQLVASPVTNFLHINLLKDTSFRLYFILRNN